MWLAYQVIRRRLHPEKDRCNSCGSLYCGCSNRSLGELEGLAIQTEESGSVCFEVVVIKVLRSRWDRGIVVPGIRPRPLRALLQIDDHSTFKIFNQERCSSRIWRVYFSRSARVRWTCLAYKLRANPPMAVRTSQATTVNHPSDITRQTITCPRICLIALH